MWVASANWKREGHSEPKPQSDWACMDEKEPKPEGSEAPQAPARKKADQHRKATFTNKSILCKYGSWRRCLEAHSSQLAMPEAVAVAAVVTLAVVVNAAILILQAPPK